jgi:hypothetical protein
VRAALLLLVLPLAGCLGGAPHGTDLVAAQGLTLVPASPGPLGPWLARTSTGCGQCSGAPGYFVPAEHTAFLLLQDLRAVRVAFTVRPGSLGFHVHPDIALDATELARALAGLQRARDGEVWVSQVWLAQVQGSGAPRLAAELAQRWAEPRVLQACMDCGGVDFWLNDSGTVRHATVNGTVAPDDASLRFLDLMAGLEKATQQQGTRLGAAGDGPVLGVEGSNLGMTELAGCREAQGPNGTAVVQDAATLRAVWGQRCGPGSDAPPPVAYNDTTVVGAWWGPQPAGSTLHLVTATREQDHARVVVRRVPGSCPGSTAHPGSLALLEGAWAHVRFVFLDLPPAPCQ